MASLSGHPSAAPPATPRHASSVSGTASASSLSGVKVISTRVGPPTAVTRLFGQAASALAPLPQYPRVWTQSGWPATARTVRYCPPACVFALLQSTLTKVGGALLGRTNPRSAVSDVQTWTIER